MTDSDRLDDADVRESLQRNIDMSAYESRVYLALVRDGKQSMKELADASSVPKQRVYDIVETLREREFVELDDSYPKKAYAIDPTKTLGPIQNQLARVEDRLDELHQAVSDIESGVAQFKNRSTIEKYLGELFTAAENTVFLMASLDRLGDVSAELSTLDDVQVRLVIANYEDRGADRETVLTQHGLDDVADHVRVTPRSEPFVLSVDRSSGFFWPDSSSGGGGVHEGFYVTDSELAFLFDRFLSDSIWPLANPLTTDEDHESPELPTQYFRLRDCLYELQSLSEDRPLESIAVEFEGYDNLSGEQVARSGTLTGFYYSEFDDTAYVEADLDADDGGSRTVTVGGWKSEQEDFKAHRIRLADRSGWSPETIDENTRALFETCRRELPEEFSNVKAVVGFDGYIDHIRTLVGERKSPRMYDEIGRFETFREMFTRASTDEKTLQFEWIETERLPGGHTAHVGTAFATSGYDLRLVGYFGQPMREEFSQQFPDSDLLSLGQPTVTEYLQFEDGKLLFTDSGSHQALTWETLCEYVPLDDMVTYLEDTDVVSIGGWPLIPEISTIWEGLAEQVYPRLDNPPGEVFVCVGDADRLTETTLRSDVESLSALDERIPVTLVVTKDDAEHFQEVFLSGERSKRATQTIATELQSTIDVSRLAVTARTESVLATGDGTHRIRSPTVSNPAEEGTVEDHFTAGLAVGRAEGLSEESTLVLGSTFAAYYKENQSTPSLADVREFVSRDDLVEAT